VDGVAVVHTTRMIPIMPFRYFTRPYAGSPIVQEKGIKGNYPCANLGATILQASSSSVVAGVIPQYSGILRFPEQYVSST
jgi:hypothetical protein